MSNLSDDDIAATRIHHADGSIAAGPVTASAATIYAVLSHLNPMGFTVSAEAAWLTSMLSLSAPPS